MLPSDKREVCGVLRSGFIPTGSYKEVEKNITDHRYVVDQSEV